MAQLSKNWLLATYNSGKVREMAAYLGPAGIGLIVLPKDEALAPICWDESGETFLDNARIKARAVATHYGDHVILADDSGLMVDALGGDPGVRSARFAGVDATDQSNCAKLLATLQGYNASRCRSDSSFAAKFVCALVLRMPDGQEHTFTGELKGHVISAPRGQDGFGYDCMFVPSGESRTMAEMTVAEKNMMSHRAEALKQLIEFLSTTAK